MTKMNEWKRWLGRIGYPEQPRAERRIPSGLTARQANNPASKPSTIKDIGSGGLYLLTEERWPVDELIPLTLELEGSPEKSSEYQIAVQARVVWHGENGIGLSFVLPPGLDLGLWDVLLRNVIVLMDPKDILYTFRMLRTVLFLSRLCGAEAKEAILLLGEELDQPRTENALEIAFGAEKLLVPEPGADRMRAHPRVVASLLKYGSWAHDDLTKQLWIGLLASSCTVEAPDDSNNVYVDLLVNVTPNQSRIFITACKKVMEVMPETGDLPLTRIIFTPEEMVRLTGIYDLSRTAVDIAYLFNWGLLEKNFDFTSYIPTESLDITPSRLGLELYKRCQGHRTQPHSVLDESKGAQPLP
ncbi:MAG: PilZ domain-containing protein [Terracidiphilus sp.]|jgi:hypothetical protein